MNDGPAMETLPVEDQLLVAQSEIARLKQNWELCKSTLNKKRAELEALAGNLSDTRDQLTCVEADNKRLLDTVDGKSISNPLAS